jgi:hypothetical protein
MKEKRMNEPNGNGFRNSEFEKERARISMYILKECSPLMGVLKQYNITFGN